MSWRWFQPGSLFTLFFSGVWLWLCLFNMPLAAQPGLLLFPAVGFFMLYRAVTACFNRTTVLARPESLSIRHSPFPWIGGRRLPREEIRQLYGVEESVSDGVTTFGVHAIDRRGMKVSLVKGLTEREQAIWLETALEAELDIQDGRVEGELRRR